MIYKYLCEIDSREAENMTEEELKRAQRQAKREKEIKKKELEEQRRKDEIDKENKDQYSKSVDYLDTDYNNADKKESANESTILSESTLKDASNKLENNIKDKSASLEFAKIIVDALKTIIPYLLKFIIELIVVMQQKKNIVPETKIVKKDVAEHITISNIRELKEFTNKKTGDVYNAFKLTVKLDNDLKKTTKVTSIPIITVVFKNGKYYDLGTNIKYKG